MTEQEPKHTPENQMAEEIDEVSQGLNTTYRVLEVFQKAVEDAAQQMDELGAGERSDIQTGE